MWTTPGMVHYPPQCTPPQCTTPPLTSPNFAAPLKALTTPDKGHKMNSNFYSDLTHAFLHFTL